MATKKKRVVRGAARVLEKVVRALGGKPKPARVSGPKKPAGAAVAKKRVKAFATQPESAVAKKLAKGDSANAPAGVADGSKAPKFELADHEGKNFSSNALEGRPYVLYFYPKDDTPGCTIEACGFRDTLTGFTARGLRVVGVSPDSVESHARFRGKHGLNFTLLSDPERRLAKAYGVWVKKQNYGREYMGIERSTFLVDAKGVVRKAWRSVRVPGHVDQVLEQVKHLR